MNDIVKRFEFIWEHPATEAQKKRLYYAQHVLDVGDNDAIWSVFLALERYQQMYEQMPQKIEDAARLAVREVETTARVVAEAAGEVTKRELTEAVAKAARDVATQTARREQWQWMGVGLAIAGVGLCGAGWLGYQAGRNEGMEIGYRAARVEVASAAWANSLEGKLAYSLARVGSLQQLAACTGRGWVAERGACFVRPSEDGKIYGWRLP